MAQVVSRRARYHHVNWDRGNVHMARRQLAVLVEWWCPLALVAQFGAGRCCSSSMGSPIQSGGRTHTHTAMGALHWRRRSISLPTRCFWCPFKLAPGSIVTRRPPPWQVARDGARVCELQRRRQRAARAHTHTGGPMGRRGQSFRLLLALLACCNIDVALVDWHRGAIGRRRRGRPARRQGAREQPRSANGKRESERD